MTTTATPTPVATRVVMPTMSTRTASRRAFTALLLRDLVVLRKQLGQFLPRGAVGASRRLPFSRSRIFPAIHRRNSFPTA